MKILQLGKAYPPVNLGGLETTIQLINEGLHKNDIYCDVLGVNNKFFSDNEELQLGKITVPVFYLKYFLHYFLFL
jgi:rhamnosyl/mannosyltransferase